MIVIRLVVYGRNLRAVTGSVAGIGGLYKTIATMLIESCALYAANSLLLIGLWAAGSGASGIFLPTFADTQVRSFLSRQPPDQLPDITVGWTGDRPTARHSTRR